MARPSKHTRARIDAALAALRGGNTRAAAAAAMGVSRATFTRYTSGYEAFRVAVEKAENEAELLMASQIRRAAVEAEIIETYDKDGNLVSRRIKRDWKPAAWWLDRQRARDWKPAPSTIEVSGPEGGPIETTHKALVVHVDEEWMRQYHAGLMELGLLGEVGEGSDADANPSPSLSLPEDAPRGRT